MIFVKSLSVLFLSLGVFVLMQVLMPVISYETWELFTLDKSTLLADPHPKALINDGQVLGASIVDMGNFPAFVVKQQRTTPSPYKQFTLSIPKINLSDVPVFVDSNDFDKQLALLPGTALPGERGNSFISGHSSIATSFFFKDETKKAWFANLINVKKGDQIYANVLGQVMEYDVIGLRVVDPYNIEVINPPDNEGRYLSLMTCVPPGFNTKRLIVLAKLKQS
jgi:LPXTG-site transpeptidase (sortase) family protein